MFTPVGATAYRLLAYTYNTWAQLLGLAQNAYLGFQDLFSIWKMSVRQIAYKGLWGVGVGDGCIMCMQESLWTSSLHDIVMEDGSHEKPIGYVTY